MGQAVEITRTEYAVSELRALTATMSDGAAVQRLLGLSLGFKGGMNPRSGGMAHDMTRRTLWDGVHRYTAEGAASRFSDASGRAALLLGKP